MSASHRLNCEEMSAEENRAVYGKCNNPHGHGHNYVVEVVVGGEVDPETGMVCDLGELDRCVMKEIVDRFDFANLNFDAAFQSRVPTTENLNIEIYKVLKAAFTEAELVEVRVEETAKNLFAYPGAYPGANEARASSGKAVGV
ncbi:MAG TPA: 6-carboxytetrahydropterin synthase [Acidobacteriaceae bacterium]|nr:6-carboxytetrahydropterin synthase [Acidobacteriaceae bacterium]